MYEVFLNDRSIIIAGETREEGAGRCSKTDRASCSTVSARVNAFLTGNQQLLVLTGDETLIWKEFRKLFLVVPAAGGIVKKENTWLFLFRKGKWDLPKGKQDEGETPEMTALREVREETGLWNLTIGGTLPPTWHLYQSSCKGNTGTWILKETRWFSMQATGSEPTVPETAEEILEVRWFHREELAEVLGNTYASLIKLISPLQQD